MDSSNSCLSAYTRIQKRGKLCFALVCQGGEICGRDKADIRCLVNQIHIVIGQPQGHQIP